MPNPCCHFQAYICFLAGHNCACQLGPSSETFSFHLKPTASFGPLPRGMPSWQLRTLELDTCESFPPVHDIQLIPVLTDCDRDSILMSLYIRGRHLVITIEPQRARPQRYLCPHHLQEASSSQLQVWDLKSEIRALIGSAGVSLAAWGTDWQPPLEPQSSHNTAVLQQSCCGGRN